MNEQLIFKKVDNTIIEDVNQYVKEWLKQYPYSEITIGCDSQVHTKYVKYSVVIVMHIFYESKSNFDRIGRGAHVISASIYDKNKVTKSDMHTKLWAETEYTIQAAEMLTDCTKNIKIHLDYNSNENELSNALYSAGIGYVTGLGYEASGKPYAWAATHVADDICKGKSTSRNKNI